MSAFFAFFERWRQNAPTTTHTITKTTRLVPKTTQTAIIQMEITESSCDILRTVAVGVALVLVGVVSVTVVVFVFGCNNGCDVDGCEYACGGVRGGDVEVCVVEGDANG